MEFWLVFIAIITGLFSIGRLLWPDPDHSVSVRSEKILGEWRDQLSGTGLIGAIQRLLYFVVYILYFPYNNPVAGLIVSGILLAAVALI